MTFVRGPRLSLRRPDIIQQREPRWQSHFVRPDMFEAFSHVTEELPLMAQDLTAAESASALYQ